MYAFLLEILRIKEITTYPMECNTIHTITFENISKFIKVSLIRLFCNTQCICYIFLQTLLGKMLTWHLDVYYVRCVLLLYYLFFCLLGITQCYRMCSLRYGIVYFFEVHYVHFIFELEYFEANFMNFLKCYI